MNLASLRRRFKHPDTPAYQYHVGAVLTPGTQNLVFEPAFQLPVFAVANGVRFNRFLRPLQPPQVWHSQAIGMQGIGGVIAGQIAMQGLQSPNNDNTLAQ